MFLSEEKIREQTSDAGFKPIKREYSTFPEAHVMLLYSRSGVDLAIRITTDEVTMAMYDTNNHEIVGRYCTDRAASVYLWIDKHLREVKRVYENVWD